ncbi:SGNH/GDSL hydrolase family protein [Sphingobium yanoikuyae]|uniref:SGNH/GDSL hydrolase family protein n=1 Tax=Sphingobium yanoikuyae TaxID=13690 RepID=UPI0026EA1A4C|nr:SGNH/GDSL hydrolase family protein [Sphingobium yanoikuyae]
MLKRISIILGVSLTFFVLAVVALLYHQGKQKPDTGGQYVALGSSFAAGLGLGSRQPGSPFICMRSTHGYPHLLARSLGLSLVDMTCSGSTTAHILHGGQVFLGPQMAAVGAKARLVTITSGGNDVGYIADLMFESGSIGPVGKALSPKNPPADQRDYAAITRNLTQIGFEIRKRAPNALIAIVSYPPVLPATGTCATLQVAPGRVEESRIVARRLAEATRRAALQTGAVFVDMATIGLGHDACADRPWVNGAGDDNGAPFHPNQEGAAATANAIAKALPTSLKS